ncbi:MAG: CoA transferase [Acidimicrobiales bacterium]
MTDRTVPSDPARRVDPREPVLAGVRWSIFRNISPDHLRPRMLVELGADVIKIEVPPYGDPGRSFAPRRTSGPASISTEPWQTVGVCRSRNGQGVEVVRRLIAKADIVVENFSPGVMARKGLSYDS